MRIVIPLFDRFTALDAVGPYEVLKFLPGAEVVFAAAGSGPVRDASQWLAITADATFADIDSCDVLLVPGVRGRGDYYRTANSSAGSGACTGEAVGRLPCARDHYCWEPPDC